MVRLDGQERPLTGPPVRPAGGPGGERGPRALARGPDAARAGRRPGGLRPQHRRPRLADPRRHRGRSAPPAAHPHRARRGLRVRPRPGRRPDAPAVPPGVPVVPGHPPAVRGAGGRGVAPRPAGAHPREPTFGGMAALAAELLPAGRSPAEHEGRCAAWPGPSTSTLALWSADGTPVGRGRVRRCPSPAAAAERLDGRPGRPPLALRLPDGRWLGVRHRASRPAAAGGAGRDLAPSRWPWASAPIPLARRLTRRLERLRAGVEGLGERRPGGPRAGGGPGRGGRPGHELQPRRRPHRGPPARPAHAAGQRVPRAALPPGPHPHGPGAGAVRAAGDAGAPGDATSRSWTR